MLVSAHIRTYLGDKQGWVRGIFKDGRLLAIYGFGESTVEKSILDAELMDRARVGDGYAEDHPNGGGFHNHAKSLIVVYTGLRAVKFGWLGWSFVGPFGSRPKQINLFGLWSSAGRGGWALDGLAHPFNLLKKIFC